MSKRVKRASYLLFLLGTFSATQIYLMGCLAISELVIFPVAPFIFLKDLPELRRHGFMPIFWLILANMFGCFICSWINGAWYMVIIKEEMVLYSMFAYIVVFHRLLKYGVRGICWLLLGQALSLVITIFAFNARAGVSATNTVELREQSLDEMIGHPLFWIKRLYAFFRALLCGWYGILPDLAYIAIFIFISWFTLHDNVTGRSAAALSFLGLVLVLVAGKNRKKILSVKRKIVLFAVAVLCFVGGLKVVYTKLASSGSLGEKALNKFEAQTHGRTGFMDIIRGGRAEFFIGLSAIVDSPIMGYGVYAVDKKGYVMEYMSKYSDPMAMERYIKDSAKKGYCGIPSHSFVLSWWIGHGIVGLLIWLYVFYLIVKYFSSWMDAIPSLFPYIAFNVPNFTWNILFSPYNDRVAPTLMITCILLAKAAKERKFFTDPIDMSLIANKRSRW